ncbi:hypothetical protein K439DRAFT_534070 [Ramaria rubella]|nr:hypothetical protein K439DRAFT_534070 [Ramaria rubella]
MLLTLRRRRRARTLSLPKPRAPYPTYSLFMPPRTANTPVTQVLIHQLAHKHHPCTLRTIPQCLLPQHSSPLPLAPSADLRMHLHPRGPRARRHSPLRLPLSPPQNKTLAVSDDEPVLVGRDRVRHPRPIHTPSLPTPMGKYVHNPLALQTPGFVSATSDQRNTRNSTILNSPSTKREGNQHLAHLQPERWD